MPNEDSMLDGESILIMDLLVELEDGSLCNVEIQKQPYIFPQERISCYSADLLMRQYTRLKGEKGKNFTYQDIKKVYVIVIYEKATKVFHDCPEHYVHYGKTVFNTGLELPLLQEYCLVALDVFRDFPYDKPRQTDGMAGLSIYGDGRGSGEADGRISMAGKDVCRACHAAEQTGGGAGNVFGSDQDAGS